MDKAKFKAQKITSKAQSEQFILSLGSTGQRHLSVFIYLVAVVTDSSLRRTTRCGTAEIIKGLERYFVACARSETTDAEPPHV